jgi:hypothetical protein
LIFFLVLFFSNFWLLLLCFFLTFGLQASHIKFVL